MPDSIVVGGKPVFGTFIGCPRRLDVRGVHAPFTGLPLPTAITNCRIKSSLTLTFSIGPYIGAVDFFDQKIFGYAEVVFWNRENGRKLSYRKLMGPRRRFIPHDMDTGFCTTFRRNRYIRISWDHARNRFSMMFSMTGDSARPRVNAAFLAHYTEESMNEVLSVMPAPVKRRCSATFIATPRIHGSLSVGGTARTPAQPMEDMDGGAVLRIGRAYYAFEKTTEYAVATGTARVGGTERRISFSVTAMPDGQVDADGLNPNFLFVDGECTPLPPVVITHTSGMAKTWVIQDFESMVDLTFTPSGHHFRDVSFFVVHTRMNTLHGTFEGALRTKDGETVELKGFEGMVRNQSMRG